MSDLEKQKEEDTKIIGNIAVVSPGPALTLKQMFQQAERVSMTHYLYNRGVNEANFIGYHGRKEPAENPHIIVLDSLATLQESLANSVNEPFAQEIIKSDDDKRSYQSGLDKAKIFDKHGKRERY